MLQQVDDLHYKIDLLGVSPDLAQNINDSLMDNAMKARTIQNDKARAAASAIPRITARQNLIATIASSFSEDELAGLLHDLNISQAINSSEPVSVQAREIVDYFARRQTVSELLAALAAARPRVDWGNPF